MKFLKRLLKTFFAIIILIVVLNIGIFTYAKITPKLEIKNANSISLYDSNNNLFFQGTGSKEWIPLKKISQNLINATLVTEDKNFYKHNGFDYLRILKASYTNITKHDKLQGASTITQQYAKNLFLDFDKTWQRKWKEMWYTIELETHYSKEEILEGYLNTINYGHGMYGIENASKFYFDKSASQLTLAEATILAGIPKSPANFSPLADYTTAKERQLIILENMQKAGMITEEEKNASYNEKLNLVGKNNLEKLNTEMYFHDAVLKELKTIENIPESYTETNGLKIYTTLDPDAQSNLEENVKNTMPEDNEELQTASVMIKPTTGEVIALVGGRNYNISEFNRATSAARQVGSTMKPFLYYAALENGFTSSTAFTSEQTTFNFSNNTTYSPKNYNDKYGNKPISMATAIAYSENVFAVKTHMFLGSDALINTARRTGITTKLENVASLPLGTKEINMLEFAGGYCAFANEGYKVKPHFIKKIEDSNGNVLYSAKQEKNKVLDSSLTFILNNMLTATYDKDYIDYNYPTAIGLASKLTHKYALKSGTTDTDNWYIGYNKDILVASWVGYDNNKTLLSSDYKYGQNIWYQTIENYEKNKEDDWYQIPDNVTGVLVDPISGKPVNEASERKKLMYFIKGSEPKDTDTVFDEKLENANPT